MEVLGLATSTRVSMLFPYQEEASRKILKNGGSGGLFLEMGTGKTRIALNICRVLGLERILVVSPLSAVGVWRREAALFWPSLGVTNATDGSIVERAGKLLRPGQNQVLRGENQFSSGVSAAIVGYESYWREPLRTAVLKFAPEAVIYDEAHRLKSRSAKQSRFAHYLADKVPFRLALTGTPMPNGIEDLFSVYKAILPSVFGTRYWEFEERYVVRGGYMFYQIVGYRNVEEVERKLAETSFRITKDEALDLPDRVDVVLPVQLRNRKIYDELRKRAIAEVEGLVDGRPAAGLALSRIVLTNVLRLQQVASGFVRLQDGRIIDLSSEKADALKDLLSDALPQAGRVVVFCRFTHDVDRAAKVAKEECDSVFILDGRVAPRDRDTLLEKFKAASKTVLVAQVAVASLGIDLSCAHVAIFYSYDYSLVNYLQSRDRLHRLGQTHKVTYYLLCAEHTVDEKVLAALQRKEDLSRAVLELSRAKEIFQN